MGNYRSGRLEFYLRKDTPFTVIESLVDLLNFEGANDNWYELREKRIERLRKRPEKIFQCDFLNRLRLEICPMLVFPWVNTGEEDYMNINEYVACCIYSSRTGKKPTEDNMFEILERDDFDSKIMNITNTKKALKMRNYNSIIVVVHISSKQYTNEFDAIVEYLSPYLIENHPYYLGIVKDEDGTLCKHYYADPNYLPKELNRRKPICDGCSEYKDGYNCSNIKWCEAAYNRGWRTGYNEGTHDGKAWKK